MHSYEDRVERLSDASSSVIAPVKTIRQLVYPSKNALKCWQLACKQRRDLLVV